MTRLIPINTSYILEKWERQNFVKRKLRVPTASLHEAVELPGKINEFLTQCVESAYHSDNRPILLQSEFGERGTIWKLVRNCQPDAFGISESEGGRRGWKMPLNKKAMVWNAFLRLVAADLNLPLPFVWPEWLIREEFRQSVCSNEREFSYILCKNVFRGQAHTVYLHRPQEWTMALKFTRAEETTNQPFLHSLHGVILGINVDFTHAVKNTGMKKTCSMLTLYPLRLLNGSRVTLQQGVSLWRPNIRTCLWIHPISHLMHSDLWHYANRMHD